MLKYEYENARTVGCETVTIVSVDKIQYEYGYECGYEYRIPYRFITTTQEGKIPVYGAAAFYIEHCNKQDISIDFVMNRKEAKKIIYGFTEYDRTQSMASGFQTWESARVRSYADHGFERPTIKSYKESYQYTSFIAGIDEINVNGLRSCQGSGKRGCYSIEELVEAYLSLFGNKVINLTKIDHYGEYCEYQRRDISQNDPAFYQMLGIEKLF